MGIAGDALDPTLSPQATETLGDRITATFAKRVNMKSKSKMPSVRRAVCTPLSAGTFDPVELFTHEIAICVDIATDFAIKIAFKQEPAKMIQQ